MKKIAIIGGTGLEGLTILKDVKKISVDTPFGKPSNEIKTGKYKKLEVVYLPRHGSEHTIPSSKVNYKANLFALQQLKCTHILSTTACGSLQEEICPGELIIVDQFIDFTKQQNSTIFEKNQEGEFRHTQMARPFSDDLRDNLIESAIKLGLTTHTKGTVITIDGPRFSTRAESNLYRKWGADIINMTTAPETIYANELKIPIATVALCTDFDSWRTDIDLLTPEEIREIVNNNKQTLLDLLKNTLELI